MTQKRDQFGDVRSGDASPLRESRQSLVSPQAQHRDVRYAGIESALKPEPDRSNAENH